MRWIRTYWLIFQRFSLLHRHIVWRCFVCGYASAHTHTHTWNRQLLEPSYAGDNVLRMSFPIHSSHLIWYSLRKQKCLFNKILIFIYNLAASFVLHCNGWLRPLVATFRLYHFFLLASHSTRGVRVCVCESAVPSITVNIWKLAWDADFARVFHLI